MDDAPTAATLAYGPGNQKPLWQDEYMTCQCHKKGARSRYNGMQRIHIIIDRIYILL